ncbi:MAG: methyl-accepting chemotaxis protein [Vicinamibacterales bacterium]
MRRLALRTRLVGAVGGLVVLFLVAGATALVLLGNVNDSLEEAGGSGAERLAYARDVDELADTLLVHERGALLGATLHKPELLATSRSEMQRIEADITSALDALDARVERSDARAAIADARAHLVAAVREWTTADRLIAAGDVEGAFAHAAARVKPEIDGVNAAAATLAQVEDGVFEGLVAHGHASYLRALIVQGGILGLALLVAAGIGWMVIGVSRELQAISAELGVGAQQVAAASSQVATAAQGLSSGATEQAASLEETSASMEEMTSMSHQNAENARAAAGATDAVSGEVSRSNQALGELVGSMAAIKESSNNIARIIKTIDEIAFQTNILALNAAVEAARAGEAGMGFAVVADEVRNLAQRSAQAAKDTATLIEESIDRAGQGAVKVDQMSRGIAAITQRMSEVSQLVQSVTTASQQQSQGAGQITEALQQMERVTQTNAATAEESAAASEELSAQAETTRAIAARLERMVHGDQSGEPAPHGPVRQGRLAAVVHGFDRHRGVMDEEERAA